MVLYRVSKKKKDSDLPVEYMIRIRYSLYAFTLSKTRASLFTTFGEADAAVKAWIDYSANEMFELNILGLNGDGRWVSVKHFVGGEKRFVH